MPANFQLQLDTTAPAFSVVLNAGFPKTGILGVPFHFTIEDSALDVVGYQYKVWGDVDPEADEHIQATEGESDWINIGSEETEFFGEVTISEGDGPKTIFFKVRDDVWNESSAQEATVELDTDIPVVTIVSGPSVSKISEVATKDTAIFTFKTNEDVEAYEVRVVPGAGATHEEGTRIEEVNGSTTEGGPLAEETNQEVKIKGKDLHAASGGDGSFTIKVFAVNEAGNWSV